MELYTQIAALPYVIVKDELLICLITSRETKRLVIPKGWPKIGVSSHQMACIEAEEEAGLLGDISKKPIGTYNYRKKLHTFATITCEVEIYPLLVSHQLLEYPENNQRSIQWFSPIDASKKVEEIGFSEILLSLEEKLLVSNEKIKTKKAS